MKKVLVLVMAMITILTACGTSDSSGDTIPEGINPDAYASGKQAIRIVEQYDAGEISIEKAFEEFKPLIDYLDTLDVTEDDEESYHSIVGYVNSIGYDLVYTLDYTEDIEGLKEVLGVK